MCPLHCATDDGVDATTGDRDFVRDVGHVAICQRPRQLDNPVHGVYGEGEGKVLLLKVEIELFKRDCHLVGLLLVVGLVLGRSLGLLRPRLCHVDVVADESHLLRLPGDDGVAARKEEGGDGRVRKNELSVSVAFSCAMGWFSLRREPYLIIITLGENLTSRSQT